MPAPPFLLSVAQMRHLSPHFPLAHGIPRVDDRKVLSGIIYVIRHGLQWRDAPAAYGPHKTLYNRFIRWSRMGVFDRIFAALAAQGGPPGQLMIEGQASDHHGAALMLPQFPAGAQELIADRGYDSARFRDALITRGIAPCIPSTRSRKQPIPHDALLYRQRHRIEIMFGRLKDWRRIAMRYDRCAHAFFSAIALAATIIFWLGQ